MAIPSTRTIGLGLIGVLAVVAVLTILSGDCACTDEGDCYCINNPEALHHVSKAEISALPEPDQSRYRAFLGAWEAEYEMRQEEWASLYLDFYSASQEPGTTREFNRQLARAYRDFLALFRQRHALFRQNLSVQ